MEEQKKSMEEIAVEAESEVTAVSEAAAAPETVEKQETAAEPEAAEEPEIAETMEDYADALEASFRKFSVGDVLTGNVIDVNEKGILIDFNYYAPGRIAAEDMSNDPNFNILTDVQIGDSITATVKRLDDGAGNLVLSRKEADDVLGWERLQKMKEDGAVIQTKITEVVPKGAIAYVEGVRGFIPASRLDLEYVEDTSSYLNKEVELQVHEVNAEEKKLILSARELLSEKRLKERAEKAGRVEVGSIVDGKVDKITDYGAFVKFGDGLSGLLHVSQISDKRIKNPRSVLKDGQEVRVQIIKVENGKISLSMKSLLEVTNPEPEEDGFEYESDGEATTSLGALFKNLKF